MVKNISIKDETQDKSLDETVKKMKLQEPQDHAVRKFFDDVKDGKLTETWSDMENIVSEMFNSRIMANIYLHLFRFPGKTLDEVTERVDYSLEQVERHLGKLMKLGYIVEKMVEEAGGKGKSSIYFSAPPEDVVRKLARSVEKKMTTLANIDTFLLKKARKAKKLTLLPIRVIVGDGKENKSGGAEEE